MGKRMTIALQDDPAKDDELILVDGLDREIGRASKAMTHIEGKLHRAFSVVIVRDGQDGTETLLSQRAMGKYHSAGLWANSCCSHPRAGEALEDAVNRRVREELGCELVNLREICAFAYRAEFDDGLAEYEYDHVFIASHRGEVNPDPEEAEAVRWVKLDDLAMELADKPNTFAAWAPMVLTLAMRELA